MARIRYLKPDFFKDEDLATLPFEVRLFFAGLWNFADKAGRLEDRPMRLKVEIFPYDKVDIEKCLQLLSKPKNGTNKPFIQRYKVNNEKYIQIVNWNKHQKPHHTEQESKFPPAPPMEMEKGMEMEKQKEGSKELRNGEGTVKTPLLFISNEIYSYYAKTIKAGAKEDAIRNITRLLKTVSKEELIGRIDAYKKQLKGDPQYYIQANNFFGKAARYKDFEPIKPILKKEPEPQSKFDPEQHARVSKLIHETAEKLKIK